VRSSVIDRRPGRRHDVKTDRRTESRAANPGAGWIAAPEPRTPSRYRSFHSAKPANTGQLIAAGRCPGSAISLTCDRPDLPQRIEKSPLDRSHTIRGQVSPRGRNGIRHVERSYPVTQRVHDHLQHPRVQQVERVAGPVSLMQYRDCPASADSSWHYRGPKRQRRPSSLPRRCDCTPRRE